MKIKTALTVFTALILAVFAGMAILLISTSDLLVLEAANLARAGESIRVSKEIKSHLLIYNRNVFLYALHKDPSRLEISKVHQTALVNLMVSSDQLVDNEKESVMLKEVKEKIADYFRAKDESQNSDLSPVEKYSKISEKVDSAISAIDNIIEINASQMRDLVASTSKQNIASGRMVFMLLTIGSLILLSLVIATVSAVTRPLVNLNKLFSHYRTGNDSVLAKSKGVKEIREIANAFNSMTERLEKSRTDQLRFIASIAHDLRNPINAMSMGSHLLRGLCQGKERGVAEIIFRQAKHLDRLVGDLLDTARIEAGEMDIELSLQDISSLISDAVELYQTDSGLHKIYFEMPKNPLICMCDRGRLSQVMNNLISNAIKYSPKGGTVTIKVREEKTQFVLSITDQGMGVCPDDLKNIFKPFHRSKASKHTILGIGLGLSTSRRIIELHGGELRVESTLGKGSTFYVILPAQISQSEGTNWSAGV
ncbi:MAG: hypothetical protein COT74_00765 [Bdellovibrionales bacterium CG10_big_fil_rev_8_21_14_0_10_45_34]|nr:MAG: hypothetical protein COT74_00765 [Bdellovibrionales bacterium CG10_big_fil_rev_8_21_14_0_10_45_34]